MSSRIIGTAAKLIRSGSGVPGPPVMDPADLFEVATGLTEATSNRSSDGDCAKMVHDSAARRITVRYGRITLLLYRPPNA
jgi:hypothetical protein